MGKNPEKQEKKQYPFRYEEDMEKLLNKGFAMYKSQSSTPIFSINKLLDICVKIAVETYPQEKKEYEKQIKNLHSQISELGKGKDKALGDLNEIRSLLKKKEQLEEQIKKHLI